VLSVRAYSLFQEGRIISFFVSGRPIGYSFVPRRLRGTSFLVVQEDKMDTVSRRQFVVSSLGLAAGAALAPQSVLGGSVDPNTKKVSDFVGHLAHLINQRDPAAVAMTSPDMYPNFFFADSGAGYDDAVAALQQSKKLAPIHVFDVRDVHEDTSSGNISATVLYSGFLTTPYYYGSETWSFAPSDDGYQGLILVGDDSTQKLVLPKGYHAGTLDLQLSLQELQAVSVLARGNQILSVDVDNVDQSGSFLTTGIYRLPKGMSVGDAQSQLAAGNFGKPLTYIGPTPTPAGEKFHRNFVAAPGTYVIQEMSADIQTGTTTVLTDDANFAQFTIKAK
jgi:hypothetical protein